MALFCTLLLRNTLILIDKATYCATEARVRRSARQVIRTRLVARLVARLGGGPHWSSHFMHLAGIEMWSEGRSVADKAEPYQE